MNVVAWRLRCRSQQRALSVFLIERFHGYRTPNLRRLPLLWLDRDRFPNLFDWDRLSNLWTGLCRWRSWRIYACRVARGLHRIRAGSAVTLLGFGGFCSRLWRYVRYDCWLD